jgi:uncharacterized protein (DUF934 family)
MRYIKGGVVSSDPWVVIEGDEPVPSDVPAIVSPDQLTQASTLDARTAPLGVAWPNDRPVSELAPHLDRLALVALEFPVFRDGRAYTQARQLRERHGFNGEVRARGEVLRDQFLFMLRAGFDAFEVRKDADAEAFARALHEFTVLYQQTAAAPGYGVRTRFRAKG